MNLETIWKPATVAFLLGRPSRPFSAIRHIQLNSFPIIPYFYIHLPIS